MAWIKHEYLVGLAVDPADPQTIIVSASRSPWHAHSRDHADSLVYRRSVREKSGKQFQKVFQNHVEQLFQF